MKNISRTFLLIILFPTFAFALSMQNQESVRERLERIESDINMMQKQVYRTSNHSRVKEILASDQYATGGAAPSGNLEVRIFNIEEKMRSLTGQIEQLSFQNKKLEGRMDKLVEDIEFRFKELDTKKNPPALETKADPSTPKTPSKVEPKDINDLIKDSTENPTKADPNKSESKQISNTSPQKDQLKTAIDLFKAKDYASSEKNLTEAISAKKGNTGEALYWLGENHYVQKQYNKAAINFLKSYKEYPKNPKSSDAIYQLALTLNKMGKKPEACDTFSKITNGEFKVKDAIKQKAIEETQKIKCG